MKCDKYIDVHQATAVVVVRDSDGKVIEGEYHRVEDDDEEAKK